VEERVGEVGTTRWIKGKREDTRELLISPNQPQNNKNRNKKRNKRRRKIKISY